MQREIGQDAIANLARQIWEQEGRPVGRDLEHWLRAEQALRASTIPATSAKPRADE